ncbi:glycosyltransferase [Rosenbergiella australiborealis]|uniref:glycosyltransferase n=1 Tax=Rosenbergiella australiborealis TaxID=1544696 RepID=UPI001F4DB5EC|nr:glycosyltransferase [Rosenbergiella australiborealis]
MSHYAVIAPPFYSHIYALEQLALALIEAGHRVTFFHQIDVKPLLRSERIGFYALGHKTHPLGSLKKTLALAANPLSPAMFTLIGEMAKSTSLFCRELPAACRQLAIDGLIVDQMEPGGALVAQKLGLPYVSIACALPLNREPGFPLAVMPFRYQQNEQARQYYASSERVYDWMMRKHDNVISEQAQRFGLTGITQLHHCFSPLAQISQLIPELDFPRRNLPAHFHATGPLRSSSAVLNTSPSRKRHGLKVYASLGTLQGHRYALFKKLATACHAVGAELLLTHCGGLNASQAQQLAKTPGIEVVDFVNQSDAIAAADITVTHGGMNTVLDSIQQGKPMLVIPLAFDQPGIAARVVHHGVGQRLSRFASRKACSIQLIQLTRQPQTDHNLSRLQHALQRAGGTQQAANIVIAALSQGQPVLARGYHG